jgi:peptidyl-prolyl cis-trans isomerase C
VTEKATDAELQDYLKKNADVFSGTLVRASHILLKVPPKASPEEKEVARQKLAQIKKEIESKKLAFADAANKYSEDDGNVAQPSGGDLGFFPRKGQFIEPFAKAAFGMKKGEISDPVETEYGLHLIYLADRKEGATVDFEKVKNDVLNQYAADMQTELVENERKSAKIDIKPMPPDLFRLVQDKPAPAPAPAARAGAGAAAPAAATPGSATPAKKAATPAGR